MRSIPTLLVAASLALGPLVLGPLAPSAMAQSEAAYSCGGISEAGRDEADSQDYALKLVYASPDGSYLGDIHTKISDTAGTVVVDTVCQGPWLLLSAAPGPYEVVATYRGKSKTQAIQVGGANSRQELVVTF